MISKEDITKIISEKIEELNVFVVEIQTNTQNSIKIFLDSEKGVPIDKCVKISKELENNLDRDIEDFELEVSSYGFMSPFKLPLHYLKNINKEVKVVKDKGDVEKGILKNIEFTQDKKDIISIELLQEKKVKLEGKKRKSIIEKSLKIFNNEIKNISLVSAF